MTAGLSSTPFLLCSRQYRAAARSGMKCPRRCTLMTSSHSSSVMLMIVRSRRIPALLTRMCSAPNSAIAWSTSRRAPAASVASSALATALPPAALISSTTCWAGVASLPEPSAAPPRSLTTTAAPSFANSKACSRPRPRPAPVMMATRPSSAPTCLSFDQVPPAEQRQDNKCTQSCNAASWLRRAYGPDRVISPCPPRACWIAGSRSSSGRPVRNATTVVPAASGSGTRGLNRAMTWRMASSTSRTGSGL